MGGRSPRLGGHFQNALGAERAPGVFVEIEVANGGRAFGAVGAFVLVLEKGRVQGAVGFAYLAVLLLEGEAGRAGAEPMAEPGDLPGLGLTLAPGEKLVLAADGPGKGENLRAVGVLVHILLAFDTTNILENNCQKQIFSKKIVKLSFLGTLPRIYLQHEG